MGSTLITVNIPIKPYLKKFLLHHAEKKKEPIRFPNKHDYNILLWRLVTNYNSLKYIPTDDKENVIEYFRPSVQSSAAEFVSIILPFNDRKDVRSYNYLSVNNKKAFRKEVRLDFNFLFSRALRKGLKEGKQRIEIVQEFKKLYNITEDELKDESLYRYSSRLLEEL